MQEIIDAIKANIDAEGKIDLEKTETAVKAAFPKVAVPKDQYNSIADKLKEANDTLTTLQNENKDVEALQKQIDEYKGKVAEKDKELLATKNANTLRDALREAGAKDIDYAVFKLGELETDADGNIKDLDSKIKSLKESTPDHFKADDDEGDETNKNNGGYKPIDNKLNGGQPPKEKQPETLAGALAEHYDKK